MHGGAMATFADAQIVAVRSYTPDVSSHTPTITLSVDYLAPAPVGSWLVLTARLLKSTRTLLFTQGLVTIGEQVVARTSAIYRNTSHLGA
jgi:acyl-coenzyme A thioesterase PaaI-like protein